MKTFAVILIGLFIISPAQASQLGCADQIEAQVVQWIKEGTRVNSIEKEIEMQKFTVYTVDVGLDLSSPDLIAIPYRAIYKVLTENGPQGTCYLVDSVLYSEVH